MCGIAGFLRASFPEAGIDTLKKMGQALFHRGPDAGGEFLDKEVALCHRRLSIIDLSSEGNQPMFSPDDRYTIVFNGEIYNFLSLREELGKSGYRFRTRTDTEVILALYEKDGVKCLEKMNGMFAFAIYDKMEKELFLARDRIGKKPLYFYHNGDGRFAFASEIKALLQIPGIDKEVENTAVIDYLKYLYIPAPKTIFENIHKLEPGHFLHFNIGSIPRSQEYWEPVFSLQGEQKEEDLADQLVELLKDGTAVRMISDVPLGAFLSGGVDSSAIVALMAGLSPEPIRTCSIGFPDKRHDEAPMAREVAGLFKTDHVEYYLKENLADTVFLLPRFFDEPFADSSAVPTYHVSRLARKTVTVALAGDGGDESFGGYEKYVTEIYENRVRSLVPTFLLSFLNHFSQGAKQGWLKKVKSLTGSALADPALAFYRTNTFIEDAVLKDLLSDDLLRKCKGYRPEEYTIKYYDKLDGADHLTRMLYTDVKTYLPGDILVKVDRMSMANSLEVRAPFLDYRVVEFAASLASHYKINGTSKKYLLRKAFAQLLPQHILNRKKHGFDVPLSHWFRHELRTMAEECFFDSERMPLYFSLPGLKQIWEEHQTEKADHGTLLWSLLCFALWQREYL